ncbi:hypothetical protein O9993_01345 [Vibrio lentus]|nr:hypothetical protein [Vibrio lentus]
MKQNATHAAYGKEGNFLGSCDGFNTEPRPLLRYGPRWSRSMVLHEA